MASAPPLFTNSTKAIARVPSEYIINGVETRTLRRGELRRNAATETTSATKEISAITAWINASRVTPARLPLPADEARSSAGT
jgi:hypothetical protein